MEKKQRGTNKQKIFILSRLGITFESAPIAIFCLVTETKGQTFRGIPGFYLTSGYTAVIISAHLVAVKCKGFTTTSTREIQLCARPPTQPTRRSPLLPANCVCQSIAHARRFKWKGSIPIEYLRWQRRISCSMLSNAGNNSGQKGGRYDWFIESREVTEEFQ